MCLPELILYIWLGIIYPIVKYVLRKFTGQCELLRLSYKKSGAELTRSIESSLKNSKTQALRKLLVDENINVKNAVSTIVQIKSIKLDQHPQFAPTLKICLGQICGYQHLKIEVENMRRIPFSSENLQHESMLMQLWTLLKPNDELSNRISKQWGDIGFQGDDPMTDFRGMGMLGLHNLVYFAEHYTEAAKLLLSHSHHPQYGYSFAIVGINMTALTLRLLNEDHLKQHFYNSMQGSPKINHFHNVYCYIFFEFDKFWFEEKPRDIMEFNVVKDKYYKKLVKDLKDKNTVLLCAFPR